MFEEIERESELLTKRELLSRRLSRIIFPLWMFLLIYGFMTYPAIGELQDAMLMLKQRTALEGIIAYYKAQILGSLLGALLSFLIFASIWLASRPGWLSKAGGALFAVGGVLDILIAYELNNVVNIYQQILERYAVLEVSELLKLQNAVLEVHIPHIILYNRLSAIAIGGAFLAFGADSFLYARNFERSIMSTLYTLATLKEEIEIPLHSVLMEMKKGLKYIKVAGILFLATGALDILFGLLLAASLANLAFLLFLIGLLLESYGSNKVRKRIAWLQEAKSTTIEVPEMREEQ